MYGRADVRSSDLRRVSGGGQMNFILPVLSDDFRPARISARTRSREISRCARVTRMDVRATDCYVVTQGNITAYGAERNESAPGRIVL